MTDDPIRPAALSGLRQLLDELDAHPGLPVPSTVTVEIRTQRDLDGLEQLARVAHRLGVNGTVSPNGTARAEKKFGPVTYAVTYHPIHTAVTR